MSHLTREPIDVEKFPGQIPEASCGGTACFIGRVRNHHLGKRVVRLYYECYDSMAERQIAAIVERVRRESGAQELRALHRVGWLEVGDVAIVVVADAAHRAEAFDACRRTVDEIKASVPIWKQEVYADGSAEWVGCADASRRTPLQAGVECAERRP